MSSNISEWLPRALVESVLIVVSILLALGLDEWQEDQEIEELIDRSITNFVNEISQNRSRIDDVSAYHRGVQQILKQRSANGGLESMEFRNIMEPLQPVVLTSSAWQTAVATGALGRMDFELVSALSLTYNTQQRFDDNYRSVLRTLLAPNSMQKQNLELTTYNASRFVADVTAAYNASVPWLRPLLLYSC
jgi:hypothetical protein